MKRKFKIPTIWLELLKVVSVGTVLLIFLLAWAIFMSGCSSTSQSAAPVAQPALIYQFTLEGEVDGQSFQSVFVAPSGPDHNIKVQSATDVNLFTIQTCHRFVKAEDVIQTGWFKANRGYGYDYAPAPGIEDKGLCVIRLGAYTKQIGAQQAHAIGVVHTADETLPGTNICDGAVGKTTGLSVCSSMAGLVERLKFESKVIVAKDVPGQCEGKFVDDLTWEYKMPLGECAVEFMEAAAPHRIYRHLAAGFNSIQYQGAQ